MAVRDNPRKSALMSTTSTTSTTSATPAATSTTAPAVDQVDQVAALQKQVDDLGNLLAEVSETPNSGDQVDEIWRLNNVITLLNGRNEELKKQVDELHAEGITGPEIMVGRIDDQGNPTTQRYENAQAAAMALAPAFVAAVPNHTGLQPGQFTVYFRDENGVVTGENFDGLDHLINHFKTIRRDFHALDALEAGQDFAV